MLLKQKNVFFKKWRKTQNSLPGINTTARCANPLYLMFPLLRRSELRSGCFAGFAFAVALFYLMIFNNISKESFEIFKTNLKTGGGVFIFPPHHHYLLQQEC